MTAKQRRKGAVKTMARPILPEYKHIKRKNLCFFAEPVNAYIALILATLYSIKTDQLNQRGNLQQPLLLSLNMRGANCLLTVNEKHFSQIYLFLMTYSNITAW